MVVLKTIFISGRPWFICHAEIAVSFADKFVLISWLTRFRLWSPTKRGGSTWLSKDWINAF